MQQQNDLENLVERSLFSHFIADPSLIDVAIEAGLSEEHFSDQKLATLYNAFKSILRPCKNILVEISSKHPKLTAAALGTLALKNHSDFEPALAKTLDEYKKRAVATKIANLNAEIVSNIKTKTYEDLIAMATDSLEQLSACESSNEITRYAELVDGYSYTLENRKINYDQGIFAGIKTGIVGLDEIIGGWIASSMYVVAARTSMGKTTFAINAANAALKDGKSVLMFTNEMSADQIVEKHLSLIGEVNGSAMQKGSLSDDELNRVVFAIQKVNNDNFFIDENSGRSLVEFERKVKFMKRNVGIDLVILDYIQQMKADDDRYDSRLAQLTEISTRIKSLSRALKIPIICLAQLNRTAEVSTELPNISQIRDCGSIEQDADCVMIIHRNRDETPNHQGEVQGNLIIGKSRFGMTGYVPLRMNLAVNKFH